MYVVSLNFVERVYC